MPELDPRPTRTTAGEPSRAAAEHLALHWPSPATRREQDGPAMLPPLLPRERARQKLAAGVPLLHGEDVDPDLAYCRERFHRLLDGAGDHLLPPAREAILAALASGRLDLERTLGEALAGHADHLATLAQAAAVPTDALASLVAEVVRPSLEQLALAYRPLYAELVPWPHAYCPVCGGPAADQPPPSVHGQPLQRCSRCAASWIAEPDQEPSAPVAFRLELGDEAPDEALDDLLELD